MNVRVITASAGTGKTTRLSQVLDEMVAKRGVDPGRIVAVTFTRQAAAELVERARGRLLGSGRIREAHALLTARIGTVHAVCGQLVVEHALSLGLAPELRVLDDARAEVELRRALSGVIPPDRARALHRTQYRFDRDFDYRHEVRRLVEAARANGMSSAALRAGAQRSCESLDACLGSCQRDGEAIDRDLDAAIGAALASIDRREDTTKTTGKYVEILEQSRRRLREQRLSWGDWAKLSRKLPAKKSRECASAVLEAAERHLVHPRLRQEMHWLIEELYDIAALTLDAYQEHKRERGVIDFLDQERLALELLREDAVRADLAEQIDVVLVDEFQDTSPLQLAIFLELASLARESVWVGDPKQAIYGFRGTDPALMDQAIESLSQVDHDPDLVTGALSAVRAQQEETLSVSFRSRPALVELTNDVFAPAFEQHGLPPERTRLEPKSSSEPQGLGSIVEVWSLKGKNARDRAAAVAVGGRDLLDRAPNVRTRDSDTARPLTAEDVAILCRTNEQCRQVADALMDVGVEAIVPRVGLLDTAEGRLVHAGLRLWLDPYDAVAAAGMARLCSYAGDAAGLASRVLDTPGLDAFTGELAVERIEAARRADPDRAVASVLDTVIECTDVRTWCARWGRTAQRLANLDRTRGHAVTYVEEVRDRGDAPTVPGLLDHFADLADERRDRPRADAQAVPSDGQAVTVSTWHRAKGLEWPVTILFGLESLRAPDGHGVEVVSEAATVDARDPLAERWVRFWPNPYTNANQRGPVRDAYEASSAHAEACARAAREALRVLYVGWTRARDRLILAAEEGKLTAGLLSTLCDIDPAAVTDPGATDEPHEVSVTWAGQSRAVWVARFGPAATVTAPTKPGRVIEGLSDPPSYPLARLAPSDAEPLPCTVSRFVQLGERLEIRGRIDMEDLGHAVHAFLAVDDPAETAKERRALAEGLLRRYGVLDHIAVADVIRAGDRLWEWLDGYLPGATLQREVPLSERRRGGTVLAGTADLLAFSPRGLVLIDHKTFPGTRADARRRVRDYSGQLAAYVGAVEAATGESVPATWIHLPVLGCVAELRVDR